MIFGKPRHEICGARVFASVAALPGWDAMEAPWGVIEMRRVEVHLPCSDGQAIEAWQVDSQGVHHWNFKICQASDVATGHPPFSGDAGGQDSKKCHQFQCWH